MFGVGTSSLSCVTENWAFLCVGLGRKLRSRRNPACWHRNIARVWRNPRIHSCYVVKRTEVKTLCFSCVCSCPSRSERCQIKGGNVEYVPVMHDTYWERYVLRSCWAHGASLECDQASPWIRRTAFLTSRTLCQHTHTLTHTHAHTHTHTHTCPHTHTHTHTHRHTHIHTLTHTDTHTYTHSHTQIHTHIHTLTHTHTDTHTHMDTHTDTHTHTHSHTQTHTHMHRDTHIHTHSHTYTCTDTHTHAQTHTHTQTHTHA